MLERTDAIKKEVLEPVTFVVAYRTVPGIFSGGVKAVRRADNLTTFLCRSSRSLGA